MFQLIVSQRRVIGLLFAILFSVSIIADEPVYPCSEQIKSGAFVPAEQELQSLQQQNPDDYAALFALYKCYVSRGNPKRDLKKAYDCLARSEDVLSALPAKDQSRAEKNGYTVQMYASEYANVSLFAQLELQRANSLEACNDFLATYDRAPKKMIQQVTKTRDALAFKEAESLSSVEAYQEFVAKYPDATERTEAEKRICILAYNRITEDGSEQDFLDYISRYPSSPYIDKARDHAAEKEMQRLVNKQDWYTQQSYLTSHPEAGRWRDTVQTYLVRYAQTSHGIEATRWGMMNLPHPYSDSCWLTLRAITLEDTTLVAFTAFHNSYPIYAIADYKQADARMADAHNKFQSGAISIHQYIDLVAPAYPAYYRLQPLIRDDIKAKNRQGALSTAKAHQQAFGNDRRYAELVRILEEPEDKSRTAVSVGAGVNTPDGNEYAPVIAADGSVLYFCGTKRPGNIGKEDIFISRKTSNGWGKAEPVAELNTADANEAPLSLTADGSTMIVFKNGKLLYSNRTKDGWGKLQPFPKKINISEWMGDAMITSDGKALLFAAMSKVPHEHQMSINIFVSLQQDNGEWGKPFGLGPQINTPRTDRSPFLHPDMKTLYFCSEGHSSVGGTDVFVSTRLNDRSWTEWSEPVNMGLSVNTAGNECWYKISTDGSLAYFSKRENKQNDLCQLAIPESFRPQPVVTVSGKITDVDGNPVTTMIQWEDLETQRLIGHTRTNPEDGQFFMVLPEGKNYGYYIYNEKLFPVSNNIDLRDTHQFMTMENNMEVTSIQEMIEKEIPITLNNLFFRTAEYTLLPASITELQRVATIIRQQGKPVEISGHTDNVGDDESNRILSEYRANAVRNYLVKLGVDKSLLTVRGYGETRPVATNSTPQGRQKNRRVEMKFIKQTPNQ